MRYRSLALVIATIALISCKKTEDAANAPQHGEHADGHQGHQGHGHHQGGGHHEVNEHGYKGHRFDDPAEWTEHFESPERAAWQKPDELVAALGLAPTAKVADLGAGTGYFSVRFAAAVPEGKVYAVDIEPAMVEWLAKRAGDESLANMIAVQGGPDDPQLPEAVDLAFMCNVFHHLADAQAYFGALAAQLAPGARVVIVDFEKDNPDHAPGPPAAMRMKAQDIVQHMQAAGYSLVREDHELLEWQYVLEFTRG